MFYHKIVDTLEKHHVAYAIVGGFAVALHGAVRGTVDLDLVLRLNEGQFTAFEKAMGAIGLVSRLPVNAKQVFQFREEYIKNRNLVAWSFYNPKAPAEVVDVIVTHDLNKMKTKKISIGERKIQVLAIDDLIKMKEAAGRPQDLEDVKALKELKR